MTGQGRVREQQKNEKGSGREEAKEADKRLCKGKKDEKNCVNGRAVEREG